MPVNSARNFDDVLRHAAIDWSGSCQFAVSALSGWQLRISAICRTIGCYDFVTQARPGYRPGDGRMNDLRDVGSEWFHRLDGGLTDQSICRGPGYGCRIIAARPSAIYRCCPPSASLPYACLPDPPYRRHLCHTGSRCLLPAATTRYHRTTLHTSPLPRTRIATPLACRHRACAYAPSPQRSHRTARYLLPAPRNLLPHAPNLPLSRATPCLLQPPPYPPLFHRRLPAYTTAPVP